MAKQKSYRVGGKWFGSLLSARTYAKKLARQGSGEAVIHKHFETGANWGAHKYGEEIVKVHMPSSQIGGGQSNPSISIMKKLRKGIKGTIKISNGRLIIKT